MDHRSGNRVIWCDQSLRCFFLGQLRTITGFILAVRAERRAFLDYDVIVIGSGFGGSITACRLAEANYRVLVLERGRRWDKTTYPREPADPWWWDPEHPEQRNGWLDLRVFRHMAVAQGAAVGGGSLIYANISTLPHPEIFARGWPPEITWKAMQPHYARVAEVMAVQRVPEGQWPPRMKLMQEAANAIGAGDRFSPLELAVSFDPQLDTSKQDAWTPMDSRRFKNAQGVEQGYCVHLGDCDIGCDVDAKNTLDRNYLALRRGQAVTPGKGHRANRWRRLHSPFRPARYRGAHAGKRNGSASRSCRRLVELDRAPAALP